MGEVGGIVNIHCIASSEDVVTLKIGVALTDGGGWGGDDNVHCIVVYVEDVVTLKIVLAYKMGGGVGGMFIALRHQKMWLLWICWYTWSISLVRRVQDVVMLKIQLYIVSRCCYVEDVCICMIDRLVTLIDVCYVDRVVMCTYECFQNGFVDVKRKKAHVHFAHGSLVDYDIFMSIKRNLKFQKKTRNSNVKSKNDLSWWTWKRPNNIETGDKISQICCPHVELIPDILTSSEEHKTL